MCNDIVIVVDYHSKNMEFRVLHRGTGRERCFNRETRAATVLAVLEEAERELGRGVPGVVDAGSPGRLVWIMESTTGWARVKALVEPRAEFLLVNVLRMPLTPRARRRKSDKLDTARVLREYLNGELPLAHQPDAALRERRRVVAWREDLVSRRTSLRNQVKAQLRHETWEDLTGLWTGKMKRVSELAGKMEGDDRRVLEARLAELDWIEGQIGKARRRLLALYRVDPVARRLDEIRGIAPVSAVSIAARIGPIARFAGADALVACAGLCPGVWSSDEKRVSLKIGGGGTDKRLRHYLIEATLWAREIPRYRPAYERACARHGPKAARVVVARMMLRSIYAMLKHGTRFEDQAA